MFFFLIFKFSSFRFKFYKIVPLLEIFPTAPKLLKFDKYLKSYSSLKKVCNNKKRTLTTHATLSLCWDVVIILSLYRERPT